MTKRLTLGEMKKQDTALYNVKREITINNHAILIDKVFRQSEVNKLLVELVNDMDYLKRQGVAVDGLDVTGYTSLLIIKHFTDVEVPNRVEDKLTVLDMLIDLGYYKPLLEAFDPEQVDKINNAMNDILDNMDEKLALIKANEGRFAAIFADKVDETDDGDKVDKVDDPEGE